MQAGIVWLSLKRAACALWRSLKRAACALLSRWQENLARLQALARGHFDVECYDSSGGLKWRERLVPNGATDVGLTHMLETQFHSGTQVTAWYIGQIHSANYSALAGADTLASHAGWEECTHYAGNRKACSFAAAAAKSITNSASPAEFTMNATETVKGAFLCSAATGTSGTLYCTALYTQGDRPVVANDVLKVTYTCGLAAA